MDSLLYQDRLTALRAQSGMERKQAASARLGEADVLPIQFRFRYLKIHERYPGSNYFYHGYRVLLIPLPIV